MGDARLWALGSSASEALADEGKGGGLRTLAALVGTRPTWGRGGSGRVLLHCGYLEPQPGAGPTARLPGGLAGGGWGSLLPRVPRLPAAALVLALARMLALALAVYVHPLRERVLAVSTYHAHRPQGMRAGVNWLGYVHARGQCSSSSLLGAKG